MNAVKAGRAVMLAILLVSGVMFSTAQALETDPLSDAPIKFQFNMAAYKGITFGMLFGSPMFFGREDVTEPVYVNPLENWYAINLGTFVAKLLENVDKWPTGPEVTIKPLIKGDLEKLKAFLDEDAAVAEKIQSKGFKTWRVRSFCADNLKGTESIKGASIPCYVLSSTLSESEAKIQSEMVEKEFASRLATLFAHFDTLEKDGLVLPWTNVMEHEQNQTAFRALVGNDRFLKRLGRCTYIDFYINTAAHPFVDEELFDFTNQAVRIGLFGKLNSYLSEGLKAANMCCDKSTLKCLSAVGYTCTMNGPYCLFTSQYCP